MLKVENCLFVTTFNQEIYEATGKNLINSFKKTQNLENASLLCFYEDMSYPVDSDILFKSITNNVHKKTFFNNNKDVIPKHLGGLTEPCNCTGDPWQKRDTRHKKGCHFTWWNRNASRWFNKVIAVWEAFDKFQFKQLIWVDSDCVFKQEVSDQLLEKLFNKCSVFYMKGKGRRVDETGIFGIQNDDKGKKFIQEIMNLYMSGNYRNLVRWDDGYVFMKIRSTMKIRSRDIADTRYYGPEVAQNCLITPYIYHNKGRHGRELGLMK